MELLAALEFRHVSVLRYQQYLITFRSINKNTRTDVDGF